MRIIIFTVLCALTVFSTDGQIPNRRFLPVMNPRYRLPFRRNVPMRGFIPFRTNVVPTGGVPFRRNIAPVGGVPFRRNVATTGGVPFRRNIATTGFVPFRRNTAPTRSVPFRLNAGIRGSVPVPTTPTQRGIIPIRPNVVLRGPVPPRLNPAFVGAINTLKAAIDTKNKGISSIISEIIRVVEQFGFRKISMSKITRAVVDVFVTGEPLQVGFKKSMSASSAEVILQVLNILNNLPGEQMSILKSTLAKVIGFRYKEQVSTKEPPPPKYKPSPKVKTALEHALYMLRTTRTGNAESQKILSDIIKYATSAEAFSNVPFSLSSSAKIVVDAFIGGRKLRPGQPSSSILQALNSLPPEEAHALISQFLKIIAFNPQRDTGIIEGISSIVSPEEKPVKVKEPIKPLEEVMLGKSLDQTNQNNGVTSSSNLNAITPFELEQRRIAEETRAQQLRRMEEFNRKAQEEAKRMTEMMNAQSQNRATAERERLSQIGARNHQSFEAFRNHVQNINARPVDFDRHLVNMNSDILINHGQEATTWLEKAKNSPIFGSSATVSKGVNTFNENKDSANSIVATYPVV